MTAHAAGLILAAGLSKRFGADKLSAALEGKPVLQHVIDAAAEVPLRPVVVVLGEPERRLDWRGARPLLNPDPARGLAGSLRVGLDALLPDATIEWLVVLLGDQPRVSPQVIRRLLGADEQPILVPRYSDGNPGNPVVLRRSAWPLAATLSGDRGMSQLFAARAELVAFVDVPGNNPDVDTPADLAALEADAR